MLARKRWSGPGSTRRSKIWWRLSFRSSRVPFTFSQ